MPEKTFPKEIECQIAKLLIRFREKKGISQEYLGTQLGMNQSSIAKIEGGRRKLTLTEFLIICNVLDVDFQEIANELEKIYQITKSKSFWTDV